MARSVPAFSRVSGHTREDNSRRGGFGSALGGQRRRSSIFLGHSNSVWGRVVADIPDFCRELVAAIAEQ
jgi:hypothetical protein